MSFSRVFDWLRSYKTARPGRFPRRIYSLWIQGEVAAPDLVRLNWDRWSRLNPDYDLIIFDQASAIQRIGDFPIDLTGLSHQAFSDVLRAKLLAEAGGVWTDASVFPVVPLSNWIDACLDNSSFFAYEAPGADRPISSWFLAARQNSPIMRAWWDALIAYWYKPREVDLDDSGQILIPTDPAAAVAPGDGATRDRYPYFWFHYLFAHLAASSRPFQEAWDQCCRKPASAPHRLQGLLRKNPGVSLEALVQEASSSEMQKLDWRASYPLDLLARV